MTLGGWSFTRGISYIFPANTQIAANGYLILARDPVAMRARYGLGASQVLGPWDGGLSNDSETLLLRDNAGNVVDRVGYADEGSFPEEPDAVPVSPTRASWFECLSDPAACSRPAPGVTTPT